MFASIEICVLSIIELTISGKNEEASPILCHNSPMCMSDVYACVGDVRVPQLPTLLS